MAKKPYIQSTVECKIAERIKGLRIHAGYSSYETFAIENDIDRKQYWRMEKGCNLTLRSIVVLANCHKISLDEFIRDIEFHPYSCGWCFLYRYNPILLKGPPPPCRHLRQRRKANARIFEYYHLSMAFFFRWREQGGCIRLVSHCESPKQSFFFTTNMASSTRHGE